MPRSRLFLSIVFRARLSKKYNELREEQLEVLFLFLIYGYGETRDRSLPGYFTFSCHSQITLLMLTFLTFLSNNLRHKFRVLVSSRRIFRHYVSIGRHRA